MPQSRSMAGVVGLIAVLLVIAIVFLGGGGLAAYWFLVKQKEAPPAKRPNVASASSSSGLPNGPSKSLGSPSTSKVSQPSPSRSPSKSSASDSGVSSGDANISLPLHEKYLPDNPMVVSSFRLDRLRAHPLYQELAAADPKAGRLTQELARNFGIDEGNVDRVTVATCGSASVYLVTASRNTDLGAKLSAHAGTAGWQVHKVGNADVYDVAEGISISVPEAGVGLQGDSTLVEAVLKRKAQPHLSSWLSQTLYATAFDGCCVSLIDISYFEGAVPGWLEGANGMGMARDLGPTNYSTTLAVYYKDVKAANTAQPAVAANIQKKHKQPDDGTFNISVNGAIVVDNEQLTPAQVRKRAKKVLDELTPQQ